VTGTLRIAPSRAIALDLSTAYSLEQKMLSDVVGNLYITRSRERFAGGALSVGVRYSPQEKVFSTINLGADLQLGAKTRLQAFTGYNGFTKEFDQQQFRIVRDLHCFNLFATYDGSRKQFRFDLALKALPFVDSQFGRSALGAGFDPALGTVR
jgi:hypothetical protein